MGRPKLTNEEKAERLAAKMEKYELVMSSKARLIRTVRKIRQEMV